MLGEVALPFLEVVAGGGDDYGGEGRLFRFEFSADLSAEQPSSFEDGEGGDGVTEDSEEGDVAASHAERDDDGETGEVSDDG